MKRILKKIMAWKDSLRIQTNNLRRFLRTTFFILLSGTAITYLIFIILISRLNCSLIVATWMCSFLSILIFICLVMFENLQCLLLLILPQFCTKRGRALMMAYAFVITFSGPATNIIENTEVITESLTCGQEQLKTAYTELIDVIKKPFQTIKLIIIDMLKSIEKILLRLKQISVRLKNVVVDIVQVIRNGYEWLGNIVNFCNKKIGTPFQRCVNVFEDTINDCRGKLGSFQYICNVTYLVKLSCYSVKYLDYICTLLDFISDSIVEAVKNKLDKTLMEIQNMFYVSINFDYSFNFNTNSSKNADQIVADILIEVKEKSKKFSILSNGLTFITDIFSIWIILKAMQYKHKFLSKNRFDNYYIDQRFKVLDLKRQELNQERALPLRRNERKKYVELSSFMLIRSERIRVLRSASFLMLSTIQIISIIMIDYSLYWLLSTIRFHGRKESDIIEVPSHLFQLEVVGESFLAEIYEGITQVLKPYSKENVHFDPISCLPDPIMPNFNTYFEIVFYLCLCWLLLVIEPYALRLRPIIMNIFYPKRTEERANWLYNSIVYKRKNLIRLMLTLKEENLTFLNVLRIKYNHIYLIRKILGDEKLK